MSGRACSALVVTLVYAVAVRKEPIHEAPRSSKRTYEPPKLVKLGDVAELTRAVGNMGTVTDGGSGSTQKTH